MEPIQYDRSLHPVQDIKRERKTNTKDGIKNKTAQAESQEDSSVPVDSQISEQKVRMNEPGLKTR